jgi:hypothetical protein
MAELHVQPKRNNYWWLWLLLALIIIAGGLYYYFNYYQKDNGVTNTTNTDTSYRESTTNVDTINTVAAGDNLWSQVNFDSPDTTYDEVSDKKVATKANAHFVIYTISSNDLFPEKKKGPEQRRQGKFATGKEFDRQAF